MFTFNFVVFAFCIASFALAGPAPLSKDNPRNIVAVADFPESGPNRFTKGYVYFTSPTGDSVKVHVDMTGLPTSGGPFVYHIHEGQIFNQKSCDEAGTHFDPFKGLSKCPNPGDDALCMVGDLSGKHGWINATCFQTEYFDKFISLNPASEAFVVGRSLVFHDQKSTRFACANINLASAEQYRDLFGAPGKNSGGHNNDQDTFASHVPGISNPGKTEDPKPQPPTPPPASPPANPPASPPANPPANPPVNPPANPPVNPPVNPPANPQPPASPAPNPEPPTPTSAPGSAPQPVPAPIKASSPPKSMESTTTVTSTVGAVASPTSSGNSDAGSNRFIHRATESSSPAALLSSDASSGNLFKGFIGTVFGVLLGIFF